MGVVRKYGWKRDLPDQRDLKLSISAFDTTNLPASVDLRPGMPAVWDQGDLGACTAHAVGAAVEYVQRKQHAKLDFMPGRLFIYYNERVVEGTVNSDSGAQLRTGIKVVNSQGVCVETLWPYDITKFKKKPSAAAYKDATVHQALKYESIPQQLSAMQSVLAAGLPFVIGFSVYESFESETVAQTGIVPLPAKNETLLGGHAVCVVGYDNSKQMFLVRNSWGPSWGLAGYFWMPYAYLLNANLADDFWAIQTME